MQETYELKVHIARDDETGRWYIASSDVPGLRLEDDDPLKLIARIELAAPELIELNIEEVFEACQSRQPAQRAKNPKAEKRTPAILPVFDSPLRLAHA